MNESELIAYLVHKGLIKADGIQVTPLTGGVSSQILLIDDGEHRLVLKRALEKLNVKEDWFADVKRNVIEQQYLIYVAGFMPEAVPAILYSDETHNFFCMEMLENGLQNWKTLLLNKQFNLAYAGKAGKVLAEIHLKSINNSKLGEEFDTLDNFSELRIEPYLLATAEKNELLAFFFKAEAKRLAETKFCLVHGDFSPKNILVNEERLVILDCEVAWYGDPVFDITFLLNHFVLKALYLKEDAGKLMQMAELVWESYITVINNEVDSRFENRVIHLLPMLMLARVDGKSPVEYLSTENQNVVRGFVNNELPNSSKIFKDFKENWLQTVNKITDED